MIRLITFSLCLAASSVTAQDQATVESDYLCITGVDYNNVDVWLLRSDDVMYILEEDGKVEVDFGCEGLQCRGSGFTVSFASSFSRSAEKSYATIVREGDPNKYVLDCTKQN